MTKTLYLYLHISTYTYHFSKYLLISFLNFSLSTNRRRVCFQSCCSFFILFFHRLKSFYLYRISVMKSAFNAMKWWRGVNLLNEIRIWGRRFFGCEVKRVPISTAYLLGSSTKKPEILGNLGKGSKTL